MPPHNSVKQASALASANRKPYVMPAVVEFGSLADITLTAGNTGNKDSPVSTATTRTRV